MVAVFTKTQKEFENNFSCFPRGYFINVRSLDDIKGRLFTGVIECTGWYLTDDHQINKAYKILRDRQPDMFE